MARKPKTSGASDHDEQKPKYAAPALEKGLDILELLASEPSGLSLSSIADKLGRSVGEIFRMTVALERRGYIAIDAEDRYALTLKMFEAAHRHPPVKRLTAAALPLMQKLADDIQQSCHLSVLSGAKALVVAQVDSPANMGFAVRLGAQLSLVRTSSGHVLLAFSDKDSRTALLKSLDEPYDSDRMDGILSGIVDRGYESVESYEIHGIQTLSYPIFDLRGSVIAALTVPFMERTDEGAITIDAGLASLERTATKISKLLGARRS